MTRFPVDVTGERLIEFFGTTRALCVQELGRDPFGGQAFSLADPVGGLCVLLMLQGQTGAEVQAWLHGTAEGGAHRAAAVTAAVVPRARADPHDLRGSFCIPTTPDRIWWPAFLSVSADEQDRYLRETVARGYTFGTILVSGPPYRNDYPDIVADHDVLRAGLLKIRQAGLLTMVSFNDDSADLGYLQPVLAGNEDLIDWCMGVWEVNDVFKNADTVLSVLTQCRRLLPACKLGVHFSPLDEGAQSYGLVDWHRAKDEAGLNALFFQSAGWTFTPAQVASRVQDFTRRLMGGMNNYPILSDGVYLFELSTSKTYRLEWTEQQAIALTDAVLHAPLERDGQWPAVTPSGFCDNGTP